MLALFTLQTWNPKLLRSIDIEVERNGEFHDMEDFIRRVPIGIEQLIILIRTDAFRFTGKPKTELLWEAHMLLNKGKPIRPDTLFYTEPRKFTLPQLEQNQLENAYDEVEFIGFPVSMTFFDMLTTQVPR